jgi:hydrogenase maturation protease
MERTLIIGYGNPDREDDGVAWHILTVLASRLGREAPESYETGFEPQDEQVDLLSQLQLMPELAETIAAYDRVCFVDAHTGAVPHDVHFTQLQPQFQASPFTHHMTPETCLSLAQALYHHAPQGVLVSVRGYQFGFSRGLSPRSVELAEQAIGMIWEWLGQPAD